jgi:predicted transcriptional regulator
MYEDARKYDPTEIRKSFKIIGGLHGTFSITKEGRDFYNEWYLSTCPELEKSAGNTGAEGRIHTNVLKLSMVLTVAEKYNLEIGKEQIEKAIQRVQTLFTNYKRLTLGSGKSQQAEPSVILLKILWEAKEYTLKRQEILYKTWADISMDDLDAVTKTLLGAGLVQTHEDKKYGTIYNLTPLAIEYFRNNKA